MWLVDLTHCIRKQEHNIEARAVVFMPGSAIIYVVTAAITRRLNTNKSLNEPAKQPLVRDMIPSVPNGMALPK